MRAIAAEKAKAEGIDLRDALWAVQKAMMRAAVQDGNVQAAKLICDLLCDMDPSKLEIEHKGEVTVAGQQLDETTRQKWLRQYRAMANAELGDDGDPRRN